MPSIPFDQLIQQLMHDPELALLGFIAVFAVFTLLVTILIIRAMRKRRALKHAQAQMLRSLQESQPRIPPVFTAALQSAPVGNIMSRQNMDELLAIEDSLMALRELYHRKLIPADVYVAESRKYAENL